MVRTSQSIAKCLRKIGIAGLSGMLLAGPAFAEETLTIASWGGAYQASQQKAYFDPFSEATGTRIITDEWSGETAKLRGMVETKTVTWNVVDVEPGHAVQGCEEGWLERIDYSKLGGRDKFLPDAALDCAVGTAASAYVFAYDASRFPGAAPTQLADLWDVKKFPGPRSLRKAPKSTLEIALLVDHVKPEDLYKVLSTPEGVDRAFKKLDEIKPYVKVWWSAGAQPPQLLADGEVFMTTAFNGRIADAVHKNGKNFKIVWDGAAISWGLWAIPKGNGKSALANKLIAFSTQPKRLADQTKYIPYSPSRPDAMQYVDPSVLPDLPTAPQNSKNLFTISAQFWADHDEELTERFNRWLAK